MDLRELGVFNVLLKEVVGVELFKYKINSNILCLACAYELSKFLFEKLENKCITSNHYQKIGFSFTLMVINNNNEYKLNSKSVFIIWC